MTTCLDVAYGAVTHTGMVRLNNEDSFLTAPPVFLVADGMGGHTHGAQASRAVTRAFSVAATGEWFTADDLAGALRQAGSDVAALATIGRAPGSTITGAGLSDQAGLPCWLVFNIGDSRTYLLRRGELSQVSVDHSAMRDLSRPGTLGRRPRNVITRALGAGLRATIADQWLIPAVTGDRLLLCSDGLSNELTDELIQATLLAVTDPQAAATALVEAALAAGGRDNITAVVVDGIRVVSTAVSATNAEDTTAATDNSPLFDDTIPDVDRCEA